MQKSHITSLAAVLLAVGSCAGAFADAPQPPPQDQALARDMLKTLVEINTTHAHESTEAAKAIQAWLITAGFPSSDVTFIAPDDHPTKGSVVVRYHGKHPGN